MTTKKNGTETVETSHDALVRLFHVKATVNKGEKDRVDAHAKEHKMTTSEYLRALIERDWEEQAAGKGVCWAIEKAAEEERVRAEKAAKKSAKR